jgi:hypothetical protein
MSFRFQAKKVGLTYSCPKSAENHPFDAGWEDGRSEKLLEFFETFGNIDQWTISQEKHESGKFHYHCYIKWNEKIDSKNPRVFDYLEVHPNVIKSPGKGWEGYVTKDKEFDSNYWECDPFAMAADMSDPEEACEYLWKKRPRDMALSGDRILSNLMRKKCKMDPLKPQSSFKLPMETDFSRAIILVGEPGIGKTQYARSHFKRPLTCDQNDDMKNWKPGCHDGLILDDISFNHMPINNQIKILDIETSRSVHARNRDARLTPAPIIITCNYERYPPVDMNDGAIARRVRVVEIKKEEGKLF